MIQFKFARVLLALVLSLSISAALVPRPVVAQQSAPAARASDYTTQLAAIEKTIDDKRKELGIPGLSLAIVKDDKVIYLKGLGVKDFEKNLPVTPIHVSRSVHPRKHSQRCSP